MHPPETNFPLPKKPDIQQADAFPNRQGRQSAKYKKTMNSPRGSPDGSSYGETLSQNHDDDDDHEGGSRIMTDDDDDDDVSIRSDHAQDYDEEYPDAPSPRSDIDDDCHLSTVSSCSDDHEEYDFPPGYITNLHEWIGFRTPHDSSRFLLLHCVAASRHTASQIFFCPLTKCIVKVLVATPLNAVQYCVVWCCWWPNPLRESRCVMRNCGKIVWSKLRLTRRGGRFWWCMLLRWGGQMCTRSSRTKILWGNHFGYRQKSGVRLCLRARRYWIRWILRQNWRFVDQRWRREWGWGGVLDIVHMMSEKHCVWTLWIGRWRLSVYSFFPSSADSQSRYIHGLFSRHGIERSPMPLILIMGCFSDVITLMFW